MRGRKAKKSIPVTRQAVGYTRVSTEEQVRAGVSLAAQEERIRAFVLATGRELADVIVDDGYSAKDLKRPGMQQILQAVYAGDLSALVVLKLDRLTRSVRDLSELVTLLAKHDVALVSVSETIDTSTAAGRMMLHLLATFAQWEREAIGERTAFALSHKRRNGKVYGPTPFGHLRTGDELSVNMLQQEALRQMRCMAQEGASLRQIGAWLTNQGIRPARGGTTWHAESVRSILGSKISREL